MNLLSFAFPTQKRVLRVPVYSNFRRSISEDSTWGNYIVAQSPFDEGSSVNLWRLIYHQNVSTVVVLSRTIEDGTRKCHQYWPDIGKIKLGKFKVNEGTEKKCTLLFSHAPKLIVHGALNLKTFFSVSWWQAILLCLIVISILIEKQKILPLPHKHFCMLSG